MFRTYIVTPYTGKGALHICEIEEGDVTFDKPMLLTTECGHYTWVTVEHIGIPEMLCSPYRCSHCVKRMQKQRAEESGEVKPRRIIVIKDPELIEAVDREKKAIKETQGISLSDEDVISCWKQIADDPIKYV